MSGTGAKSLLDCLGERARDVARGAPVSADMPHEASAEGLWELLQALMRFSGEAIAVNQRESRIFVEVSESFCELTGYDRSQLLGRRATDLGLIQDGGIVDTARANADTGGNGLYETTLRRRDGQVRDIEFTHRTLGEHYVVTTLRDVTRRREMERELRRLAETDPLTGLLNRRKFVAEVDREIRESHRFGDEVSLIVLDVDGLKQINDQHGHHVGDAVLCALAETVNDNIRDTDFAGRLGGDEFAILLTRAEHAGVSRIVDAVLADLGQRVVTTDRGAQVVVSASAGLATVRAPDDYAELLAKADAAMYEAKRRRKPHRSSGMADVK